MASDAFPRHIGNGRVSLRTGAANALSIAAAFGQILLVGRYYGATAVGSLTMAYAVATPVFMAANLGFRNAHAVGGLIFWDRRVIQFLRVSAALIAVPTYLLASMSFEGKEMIWPITFAVGSMRLIECASDMAWGQMLERSDLPALSLSVVLRSVLASLLFTLSIATGGSLSESLALWSLGLLIAFMCVDYAFLANSRQRTIQPSTGPVFADVRLLERSRELLFEVAPVTLAVLLGALAMNTPRYLVRTTLGVADLGSFAVPSYALVAITSVLTASAVGLGQRLADLDIKNMLRRFETLLIRFCLGGALLALIFAYAVRPLLGALMAVGGAAGFSVYFLCVFAGVLQALGATMSMAVLRALPWNRQLRIAGVEFGVGLLCGVLFIPRYGLFGASLAYVAMALTRIVIVFSLMRRQRQISSAAGVTTPFLKSFANNVDDEARKQTWLESISDRTFIAPSVVAVNRVRSQLELTRLPAFTIAADCGLDQLEHHDLPFKAGRALGVIHSSTPIDSAWPPWIAPRWITASEAAYLHSRSKQVDSSVTGVAFHNDFGLTNVGVCCDGQLVVFDASPNGFSSTQVFARGPALVEIGQMTAGLVGQLPWRAFALVANRRRIQQRFVVRFLQGYEETREVRFSLADALAAADVVSRAYYRRRLRLMLMPSLAPDSGQ